VSIHGYIDYGHREALINSELFLDDKGFICLWPVKFKQHYGKLLALSSGNIYPKNSLFLLITNL
jgi:hypothetical protein